MADSGKPSKVNSAGTVVSTIESKPERSKGLAYVRDWERWHLAGLARSALNEAASLADWAEGSPTMSSSRDMLTDDEARDVVREALQCATIGLVHLRTLGERLGLRVDELPNVSWRLLFFPDDGWSDESPF